MTNPSVLVLPEWQVVDEVEGERMWPVQLRESLLTGHYVERILRQYRGFGISKNLADIIQRLAECIRSTERQSVLKEAAVVARLQCVVRRLPRVCARADASMSGKYAIVARTLQFG